MNAAAKKILALLKKKGVLRPRELDPYGIPREYLKRLRDKGIISQVGRGLYVLPETGVTEHHSLAQAAKRVPHGVVCLLSALRYHELTDQMPFEVWMAIAQNVWQPKVDRPVIRFVRFSGAAFTEGIEEHSIDGVSVKVFCASKTVADCFKFRNKIGLDVAIEALKDCLRQKKCLVDDLWHYAEICRVTNIIRPYLEAVI